jgi:hypothetical protein
VASEAPLERKYLRWQPFSGTENSTNMQNELFKQPKRTKRKSRLEIGLLSYDKNSFIERLDRLRYIKKIHPKKYIFAADTETVFIMEELKTVYVNGGLISTVLLSQAFIERKLQSYFNSIGLERIANKGLKAMLDHGHRHGLINEYFVNKFNDLRQKRNPFTHLKDFDHEFNLSQRFMKQIRKPKARTQPFELLKDDAKEAITLAYAVFVNDLK